MSKDNGGPASDKIKQAEMAENIRDARRAMFMDALEKRNAEREKQYLDALTIGEVSHAWWAFNAALDCVVLELPPELHAYTGQPQEDRLLDADRNHTIKQCRAAIESTNLGIKVK